jgi:GTPase
MLFATLDPTLRAVDLPHGHRIILSDTVGFISSLPTMLVAAFRATLEEVIEADVILHVRDVSHEDSTAQSQDVVTTLRELGIEPGDQRLIDVWNKIDRLSADHRVALANQAARRDGAERPALVSAVTGEGIDVLNAAIDAKLARGRQVLELALDPADGSGLSWLYRHTEVLEKELADDGRLHVTVRGSAEQVARVRAKFAEVVG